MRNKFLLALAAAATIFTSCGIEQQVARSSKKLSRSAQKNIIDDPALKTAHVGISLYDVTMQRYRFNYQGDKYFVPASNTKLPTCYAAMKYLGDSLQGLKYAVTDNKIVIQGTGDPTFLNKEFKNQRAFQFLVQTQKPVLLDPGNWQDQPLGSGWSWNDYMENYMADRSSLPLYGNLFTIKMDDSLTFQPSFFKTKIRALDPEIHTGINVYRSLGDNELFIGKGNQKIKELPFYPDQETVLQLLRDTLRQEVEVSPIPVEASSFFVIKSQPTDSLLKIMMHRSDNFFAEQSLLMVSNQLLGVMNDVKIIDTLLKTDFKDLPQKPHWVDGSGLSRYNLFSPQDFVFILNKMRTDFGMERMKNILPTGNTGTLSKYYIAENGYIFAKTGSLSGVIALSGFLYTKGKHLFVFSVLVNNYQSSGTEVRRAVERFIEGVRNDL